MTETEEWLVIANCRVRGAIGIFYRQSFLVNVPKGSDTEVVKETWQANSGEFHELEHFVSFEKREGM